jgi:ABC-type molybdate transport system substrate-binding protein
MAASHRAGCRFPDIFVDSENLDALTAGADTGLTVMNGAPPAAQRLADFIMSPQGQEILTEHGFATGK